MAVLGANAPKNLVHVVINNGAHETVGGMPTVASKIDLVSIAMVCGYPNVQKVKTFDELGAALSQARLVEELCSIGAKDNLGRPTTTVTENKENFTKYLNTK